MHTAAAYREDRWQVNWAASSVPGGGSVHGAVMAACARTINRGVVLSMEAPARAISNMAAPGSSACPPICNTTRPSVQLHPRAPHILLR